MWPSCLFILWFEFFIYLSQLFSSSSTLFFKRISIFFWLSRNFYDHFLWLWCQASHPHPKIHLKILLIPILLPLITIRLHLHFIYSRVSVFLPATLAFSAYLFFFFREFYNTLIYFPSSDRLLDKRTTLISSSRPRAFSLILRGPLRYL